MGFAGVPAGSENGKHEACFLELSYTQEPSQHTCHHSILTNADNSKKKGECVAFWLVELFFGSSGVGVCADGDYDYDDYGDCCVYVFDWCACGW